MKIFHWSNPERDLNGRFARTYSSIKSFFKKMFVVAVVIGIGYSLVQFGRFVYPTTVFAERQVINDSLDKRIEELKNETLDTLEKCESSGHKESDGIIIFDTNSRASIGTFQFQKATVQHYYKTLYGQTISAKEAVLIALDAEKARKLAGDIIFTTDKGLTNWINCTAKYNLTSKVKFIKEL